MQKFRYLQDLQLSLLSWWQKNGRVLPWRAKLNTQHSDHSQSVSFQVRESLFQEYMTGSVGRDPYQVVVSELMLQQTQVDRVMPKYLAWMKKWPRIENLAQAELAEVLIFWQGLGYNRRARFLWLLAQEISLHRKGLWPKTEDELLKLPGIGRYTARAVLSFAFGQQVAVVDTNVKRVIRRITEGKEVVEQPILSEKQWFAVADSILPKEQADPWNQLVMDLGAMVCTAKAPKCEGCPVRQYCEAQQKAVSQGFATYREYLQAHPPSKLQTEKKKLRFEDTDRYFRGRIIDHLRQNSYKTKELFSLLSENHGLESETRFTQLLKSLQAEGLLSEKNGVWKLG